MTLAEEGLLQRYLAVLMRRAIPALCVAGAVVALVLVYTLRQSPMYEATAVALINRQQMDLANSLAGEPSSLAEAQDNGRLAFTEAGIAESPAVAMATIRALHLTNTTVIDLESDISVVATSTTDLLTITASSGTSAGAQALANTYAGEYVRYAGQLAKAAIAAAQTAISRLITGARHSGASASLITSLESRQQLLTVVAALHSGGDIQIASAAVTATKSRPKPVEDAVLAAVLGLFLGVLVAFAIDILDTRVRGGDEAAESLGLAVLARVPKLRRGVRGRPGAEATGAVAEAFRMLRTGIDLADVDRRVSSVLITSSRPLEGKTTIASNLALAIARSGQSVALIDLDLRRPAVAKRFGIETDLGITSVAAGRATLAEAVACFDVRDDGVRRVSFVESLSSVGRLLVLPSGPLPPEPGDFVQSKVVAGLVAELGRVTDFVIIDSPPLLSVSDPLVLSTLVQGVVFVVRPELVKRHALAEARRLLAMVPVRVLGLVINGTDDGEAYTHTHYYRSHAPADPAAPVPVGR
jgi:succinoglycan biosynthesis transport protein ExoP